MNGFKSVVYKLIPGRGVVNLVGALEGEATMSPVVEVEGVSWPFPACPLNGVVSQETAETWYDNAAGLLPGSDGFFVSVATIFILRDGTDATISSSTARNRVSSHGYHAARTDADPTFDLPHFMAIAAQHDLVSGGADAGKAVVMNRWGYIAFENIAFWQNNPVQFDFLNFSEALFDPAQGGGVEICCADGPGTVEPTERTNDGLSVVLEEFGLPFPDMTHYVGDPPGLPQIGEVLYTITSPSQLPISIPNPAGRAFIIRTVNQDPQGLAPDTNIVHDIGTSYVNDDPAAAYRLLDSDAPTTAGNTWTIDVISGVKIKSLARVVSFGGALDYVKGVLVYRDPARLSGNTLRVPVTAPFAWYIEDPDDTFVGDPIDATITAYAVDESELVGPSADDWAIIKAWTYNDVQARKGAALTTANYTTTDQSTFGSGAGNLDVDVSGGRRLVYYEITACAPDSGHAGSGQSLPAILHSNPSLV